MHGLDLDRIRAGLRTRFVGRTLLYLPSAGSTMDVAKAEAEHGSAEGTVVLADEQTAGRGRFGRRFVSPPGVNLYPTVILRPSLEGLKQLGIVASLAVARAVEECTGLRPSIKWPNDVLLDGRKFCGILIETEFTGSRPRYSLVGIGVDVNLDVRAYPEIAAIATSLAAALGREVSREDLLAALLNHLEALYLHVQDGGSAVAEWKGRLETLGKRVRVSAAGTVEEGVAEDVDREGNLVLRRADGTTATMVAGEVTLRA